MDYLKDLKPFTLYFNTQNGMSDAKATTKRYLTNMRGMYLDDAALEEAIKEENKLIYEFYEISMPETSSDLLFGTSITYPGKVGNEYYMTKGHFHTILDTAEVYYCLKGEGFMLMEDPEGNWDAQPMSPGKAVYVPPRWAHRTVNSGNEELVTFFVFRADAGHDYGTIETKGYRKLIVEKDGKPEIIDNPKWK
jgi:glucose-6-phosphate isomerase, archaeal